MVYVFENKKWPVRTKWIEAQTTAEAIGKLQARLDANTYAMARTLGVGNSKRLEFAEEYQFAFNI